MTITIEVEIIDATWSRIRFVGEFDGAQYTMGVIAPAGSDTDEIIKVAIAAGWNVFGPRRESKMETETISAEALDALPDYTVGQPYNLPVGARWKVIHGDTAFVGEMLPDGVTVLRRAIII